MSPSMGTALPASLVKHRLAFATFVTSNEDDDWQLSAEAKRLYGLFHEWNQAYFGGRLVVPHILLSEPKASRALGDTARYSGGGLSAADSATPFPINGDVRLATCSSLIISGRWLDYIARVQLEFGEKSRAFRLTLPENS
jgi:hypothetical protein